MNHPNSDVLIIDFGGQYSQLIARRVRDVGVYCELVHHKTPLEDILVRNPKGLILSGGPTSVYGPDAPRGPEGLLETGLPTLGICYGMQYMAHELGAGSRREPTRITGRPSSSSRKTPTSSGI